MQQSHLHLPLRCLVFFMIRESLRPIKWFTCTVYIHYKLLYWSNSQTKQVTNTKPALIAPVVFTCLPKGYVALWKKKKIFKHCSVLYVCAGLLCICMLWFIIADPRWSALCATAHLWERQNFHIASSVTFLLPVTTQGARHFGLKLGAKYMISAQIIQRGQRIYSFYRGKHNRVCLRLVPFPATHPN